MLITVSWVCKTKLGERVFLQVFCKCEIVSKWVSIKKRQQSTTQKVLYWESGNSNSIHFFLDRKLHDFGKTKDANYAKSTKHCWILGRETWLERKNVCVSIWCYLEVIANFIRFENSFILYKDHTWETYKTLFTYWSVD